VPIDELLKGLGYSGATALRTAREAIEAAGLTNSSKLNIHPRKRKAINSLLGSRYIRVCGSGRCASLAEDASPNRRGLKVEAADCEVCGGQRSRRAVASMKRAFARRGMARLLILGGAPDVHAELRALMGKNSPVRLDLIDGARTTRGSRTRDLAQGADVVVIWGSTILPHSVSNSLNGANVDGKTVTVTRRSIEALAEAVEKHLE
jgi:hypothetical protein